MNTRTFQTGWFSNRFVNRVIHKTLWALVLPLCAVWGLVSTLVTSPAQASDDAATARMAVEWPTQWQGAPVRPLALGDVEQRFAHHFPGSIARMTDGRQKLVLRTVTRPTRKLHPATDCYRGLGYRVHSERLELQADHQRWRCFTAERAGQRLRVCERIEDAHAQGYTDTSAWYWAAVAGQSQGPWRAVTVATPVAAPAADRAL